MHCSRSLDTQLAQQMRLPESQRRWLAPLSTSTPPRTVPHTLFRSYHRWSSSSNHGDSPPPLPRDRRHWVVGQSQHREQQGQERSAANQKGNSSHSSRTSRSCGDSSRWSETLCRSDAPHRPTRATVAIDCPAKSSSATTV